MILHSPTERGAVIRHLVANGSDLDIEIASDIRPEQYGVDFAWRAQGAWWGIQRKELNDLLASLDDGRLSKEIGQMASAVTMPHLMIEGRISVDLNGNVGTNGWGRGVTISSLRGRFLSIGLQGVYVSFTADAKASADAITDTYMWSKRASHSTARTRPKPLGAWGTPTNREYQAHLLQGLPDVGAKTAEAILDHFGRCPLVMDVDVEDLMGVPGIGRKTAERIMKTIRYEKVASGPGVAS